MKHLKYLLCVAVMGAAAGAWAQPPDAQPPISVGNEQLDRARLAAEAKLRNEEEAKRRVAQAVRQAEERQTPSGTLRQFARAINDGDLALAARCVAGEHDEPTLLRIENASRGAYLPARQPLGVGLLSDAAAPVAGEAFEARVFVSLRSDEMIEGDPLVAMRAAFLERVSLRRGGDGEWKIVPRARPAFLAAVPEGASVVETAKFLEGAVVLARDESDGFLNAWARRIADSKALLPFVMSRQSMSNLKQAMLGILQFMQDHNETYAFTPENLAEKVRPYVRGESVLLAPALGDEQPFSYQINRALLGKRMAQVEEVARTVVLYEGDKEGKPLFRFDGEAVIGFADGHVELVSPERAEDLVWEIK